MHICARNKLFNLIPLILFPFFDCVLGIGINPFRPMIVAVLLIMDICLSQTLKEYLHSSLLLLGSCIIGIIISTTCYYYFISNDFETPIVGFVTAIVYAIGVLLLIGIGAIIVYLRKKESRG